MIVKKVTDCEFKKYGRVLKNYDLTDIICSMQDISIPEDIIYEPSIDKLESIEIFHQLETREFGGMPIQIGYCNGNNYCLNALEYHRSSEINIAVTDMILLVGSQQDIKNDYFYDTSNIEAFLVPAGVMIEIYATTLHYAPCNAGEGGFKCIVVLPRGTNMPLSEDVQGIGEDRLLFSKNKWLIAHKDANLDEQGVFVGLTGKNISVK